jgi:class 3 adenylate cyclase
LTTGSGDTAADRVRISDADRQAVIDRLREHTAAGRITLDEFEDRLGEVAQARTVSDLRATLRDLPLPMPVLATERALGRQVRRRRAMAHVRNFVGINSVCIGIWAVTGAEFSHGGFWPEWVLLFSGLGLVGSIATNKVSDQEKKEINAQKLQELTQPKGGNGSHTTTSTRVLATILYTDVVDSTRRVAELGDVRWSEVLDEYEEVVKGSIERAEGRLVKVLGDGALARFAAPAEAIRCARAIRDASRELGFEVRAGVHAGEIEIRGDDVTGIAVHLGQRVCAAADPGEVWVTRTVVDLVAGAGIQFADQGEHQLRGISGPWQLYSVTP